MPRPLPREVAVHLEKAKESAVAAVDNYNRSGTRFRSGSYIVLMCIGWASLLQAVFFQRKVKPFYRDKQNPKRYARVDGDYKAWELATCLEHYFKGTASPVADNLCLLIGLRNKIEHRSMPELDCHNFVSPFRRSSARRRGSRAPSPCSPRGASRQQAPAAARARTRGSP